MPTQTNKDKFKGCVILIAFIVWVVIVVAVVAVLFLVFAGRA